MSDSTEVFEQSIKNVKTAVLKAFEDDDVKIVMFGSRARGNAHSTSDIDIGILPLGEYDRSKLPILRTELEDMNIPYTVDLVDLSEVSGEFRQKVLDEGEILDRSYKLKMKVRVAKRALDTLKEIMDEPYSVIIRDAAIQRFEYTFEAVWNLIKEYLVEREGVVCNSPKSCFREAFKMNIINEDESVKALYMTDDRNMTTHTYHEDVAGEIYKELAGYYNLMNRIYINIVRDCELE